MGTAMEMTIPTKNEWRSEAWDIDTEHAYKMFAGKSRDQAYALFSQNAGFYYEDVMSMPTACFDFYVRPYLDYLLSSDSHGDSDGASCFFALVRQRAADIVTRATPLRQRFSAVLEYLADHQDWYEADPEIYGDFTAHAEECRELINDPA